MSKITWSVESLKAAVPASTTFSEVLGQLGLCKTGSNHKTIKKYILKYGLSTSHFLTRAQIAKKYLVNKHTPIPLKDVLVKGSTYGRSHLKKRLYAEGLKKEECEECGQGPIWRGRRLSMILDHINGIRDDNRLENLRILCPQCNATLETHCGRKKRDRCPLCNKEVALGKKYCSTQCAALCRGGKNLPRPHTRKVPRPSYVDLLKSIEDIGYSGAGRRFGVSDNAIRKWVKVYENNLQG